MPVYSHTQLTTYEQCPLKYKLSYRDKIKREIEGIEAFLGTNVHETLRKCYDDARITKINSLEDILFYYDTLWQKEWNDSIIITRKDLTKEHYQNLGKKMIESYYNRFYPFDSEITIATEKQISIYLGTGKKHLLTGFIDRLTKTGDTTYQIHDYKTSAYLPTQQEADNDRQLALYQIGVKQKWPAITHVKLIWHYLAFDTDLVSSRSDESISKLTDDTMELIDQIEAAGHFPPKESALCNWCEYPDLCPLRKHLCLVEALPVNEYINEPGVVLVNRFAQLKEQDAEIKKEMEQVKEALVEYATREQVEIIKGSDRKVRVKTDLKLKFPGKNDNDRAELDKTLQQAGKWSEVSQLDTAALTRQIEAGSWSRELVEQVMQFGRVEQSSAVYLSRLKDDEK